MMELLLSDVQQALALVRQGQRRIADTHQPTEYAYEEAMFDMAESLLAGLEQHFTPASKAGSA